MSLFVQSLIVRKLTAEDRAQRHAYALALAARGLLQRNPEPMAAKLPKVAHHAG